MKSLFAIMAALILIAMVSCAFPGEPETMETTPEEDSAPAIVLSDHDMVSEDVSYRVYDTAVILESGWIISDETAIVGHLDLLEYQLSTGSVYTHLRFSPAAESHEPPRIRLETLEIPAAFRYLHYPRGPRTLPAHWSEPIAVRGDGRRLPRTPVVIEDEGGTVYAFYSGIEIFEWVENEVVTRCLGYYPHPRLDHQGITLTLDVKPGRTMESWTLLSIDPHRELLEPENTLHGDLLGVGDFAAGRLWTREGMLYSTLPAHIPSPPEGYYVNRAHHVGRRYLDHRGEGPFFEDFALVSLHTAANTQHPDGYWTTGPGSTWLKGLYDLGGGLYDTRWSTDAASFLLEGYREYGDERFRDASVLYADFLSLYARENSSPTESGGLLVWDYADPNYFGELPVHTSLNHQLAEMNFLYEMHLLTGDDQYLGVAEDLLAGIIDTVPGWPRPDGDLWYGVSPEGEFFSDDYPILTYNDLIEAQRIQQLIYGHPHPGLDTLLEIKRSHLDDLGILPGKN